MHLYLDSEKQTMMMKYKCNTSQNVRFYSYKTTDNSIGSEGATALGEALKTNATLKTLRLTCKQLNNNTTPMHLELNTNSETQQHAQFSQMEARHWERQ